MQWTQRARLTFVVVSVTVGVVTFPINTSVLIVAQVNAEKKLIRHR